MATATAASGEGCPHRPGSSSAGVSWGDYEAMLRIVGGRPIRITDDRGDREIFVPSFGHNSDAYLLGRMVEFLTEELEVFIGGGDTTTLKRQDQDRNAEPDKCDWFGDNARRVRSKMRSVRAFARELAGGQ